MKCLSCNKTLNDYESTRKYANSLEYVDMCSSCFNSSDLSGIPFLDREDLITTEEIEDIDETYEDIDE